MSKPMTAEDIAKWAEGKELPTPADIAVLASQLDIEGATEKQRNFLAVMTIPHLSTLSVPKKAAVAGVSERYAQDLLTRKDFRALAAQVIRQVWGNVQLEMQNLYIGLARAGDKGAIERIMEQGKSLSRPEKGDTNVIVAISVEMKQQLERRRTDNQSRGLESLGYTLHTDS